MRVLLVPRIVFPEHSSLHCLKIRWKNKNCRVKERRRWFWIHEVLFKTMIMLVCLWEKCEELWRVSNVDDTCFKVMSVIVTIDSPLLAYTMMASSPTIWTSSEKEYVFMYSVTLLILSVFSGISPALKGSEFLSEFRSEFLSKFLSSLWVWVCACVCRSVCLSDCGAAEFLLLCMTSRQCMQNCRLLVCSRTTRTAWRTPTSVISVIRFRVKNYQIVAHCTTL